MTLANLSFYTTMNNNDEKILRSSRKETREAVKSAIDLYEKGHISEELLKAIAEMALAVELSEGIEIKLAKKSNKFSR